MKAQMALAPSALSHLESAHQLFSQVLESSRTVKILVRHLIASLVTYISHTSATGRPPETQRTSAYGTVEGARARAA